MDSFDSVWKCQSVIRAPESYQSNMRETMVSSAAEGRVVDQWQFRSSKRVVVGGAVTKARVEVRCAQLV